MCFERLLRHSSLSLRRSRLLCLTGAMISDGPRTEYLKLSVEVKLRVLNIMGFHGVTRNSALECIYSNKCMDLFLGPLSGSHNGRSMSRVTHLMSLARVARRRCAPFLVRGRYKASPRQERAYFWTFEGPQRRGRIDSFSKSCRN